MLNERLLEETFCVDVCELLKDLGSYDKDVIFLTGLPVGLDEDLGIGVVREELYSCNCMASEGIINLYWFEEGY